MSCPFCDCEGMMRRVKFIERIETIPCERWVDYGIENGEITWYSVLAPEQYTEGHALVILHRHRETIADPTLTDQELKSIAQGVNRVSHRLRDWNSQVKAVHALSLCESVPHLHFHLIPRYEYDPEDMEWLLLKYTERQKKLGWTEDMIQAEFKAGKIHGIWYDSRREMGFPDRSYYVGDLEQRARNLSKLAAEIRQPGLLAPWVANR